MKLTHALLSLAVAALATGCANSTTDDGQGATGAADDYVAREVVGVRLLTTDYRFDNVCSYMEEGLVEEALELGPTTEMNVTESVGECRYNWKGGQVNVSFGNSKPYPSIYKAEYEFDKMYQPQILDSMGANPEEPALFGPAPQGTASSVPAIATARPETLLPAVLDSANANGNGTANGNANGTTNANGNGTTNGTANSNGNNGTSEAMTKLTQPAYSTTKGVAVPGVGDKALWDAKTSTLHVLFLNQIINMTVRTDKSEAVERNKAVMMMQIIIGKLAKADR